jgi:TRAP-type mannitol/chloroaromatic compound transport system substrate-binding protein
MGAAVEELAHDEILAAVRGGRLDAVALNNPTSDRQLGLPALFPVCMLGSYHQPAQVFEVLFNKQRYDSMPADLRAIARHAAQAASADMSWKAADRYSADYAELRRKPGIRFRATPPQVLRAQLRAWSDLAARRARENPYFEKIFQSQQMWARRAVGWALDTEVDRRLAYDHWFAGQKRSGGSVPS